MSSIPVPTTSIILYPNLDKIKARPCIGLKTDGSLCGKPTKGPHDPVFCHIHRHRPHLRIGWAYITREEAELLTLLRDNHDTDTALDDLRERYMTHQLAAFQIFGNDDEEENDEYPGTPEPAPVVAQTPHVHDSDYSGDEF